MLYMDVVSVRKNENNSSNNKQMNRFEDLLTKQDVEITVKNAFGPTTKIINYHVRTYSEEKLGFLGDYRHLVVTVQKDGKMEKEIVTFFIKSIPYNIEEQCSIIAESRAFQKETNFYKKILPEFISSINDKSWIAQCYLVKDDLMVFEDLKSSSYALKSKLLDKITLQSALTVLAKLHASSLLTEKRLGKSLCELYPDLLKESLFIRQNKFSEWFRTGVDVAVAIAKVIGLDYTSIPKICNRIYDMISTSKTRQNVVCHGDAKSYNFMFKDSQPLPKCIMVDFQLIRYVPPMADILQLMYLTTRRNFRDENEEELLRYYHEVLCSTLRNNNKDIQVPSFSEIFQEYEEMRVIGIVTTALYSPIHLTENHMCATLTKDSDGFAKLLFGDRVDLVLNIMQKDSFYNDMMTEIITEMVDRSKQLLS